MSFAQARKTTQNQEKPNIEQIKITDVCSWMINDKLMLNDDKTEFLVIGMVVHSFICILSDRYGNTLLVNVLRN